MIELLKSIVDIVIALVSFLIHSIYTLVVFIGHIPTYISFFISSFDILPAVILPFAVVSVYIYVLYFILARNK